MNGVCVMSLKQIAKNISRKLYSSKSASFIALAVFGSIGVFLSLIWARSPFEISEQSVAEQWNHAISRMGIEPVYPPQEDLVVGDIILITKDLDPDKVMQEGGVALGGRSLKLWRMDLSSQLDYTYANTFTFPKTKIPESVDSLWEHEDVNQSIFYRSDARKHMPLVSFPEMTVATIRGASAASNFLPAGIGGTLNSVGGSGRNIEIKIRGAESYGVPYLIARGALEKFCLDRYFGIYCTDAGARTALSSLIGKAAYETVENPTGKGDRVNRIEIEIMIVSYVYLTRQIDTVDSEEDYFGAGGGLAKDLSETIKNLNLAIDKNIASDENAAIGDNASIPVEDSADESTLDMRTELKESADMLNQTLERINAHNGAGLDLRTLSSRGLSVNGRYPRPVAIGFQSVRQILTDNISNGGN